MSCEKIVTVDPWQGLRTRTTARIAIGRAGGSLPTAEVLQFQQAHAAAREAVHSPFQAEDLAAAVRPVIGETLVLSSAARDRRTYLLNPDLGRRLDGPSIAALQAASAAGTPPDVVLVIADGLSSLAVHEHALPLVELLKPRLEAHKWRTGPAVIVRHGRVAVQDHVGEILGARLAVILIGERPGLRVADSLGAYLCYRPRVDNTDAQRNCVSNIRPQGLPLDDAADTICYLLAEADRLQLSGVPLKDRRPRHDALPPAGA